MRFQPPLLFVLLFLAACGSSGGGEIGAPTVSETIPSNQETDVPVDSPIRAKFSSRIDPVTVNEKNFFILDTTGPMAGGVTYQNQTAVFTPSQPLGRGRQYNAVLTTGIKDLDGVPLPSNFTWSFVTEGERGEDIIPPRIEVTVPRDGEENVSHTAPILVVFSEPIDPNTINDETFFIKGVTGTHAYDESSRTAKLVPSPELALWKTYEVTVTKGIKDLAGNALTNGVTWSFKTVLDLTPPRIEERSPGENAKKVPVNSKITITFDEEVIKETLEPRFVLFGPSGEVQTRFSYQVGSKNATLEPLSDLEGETTYRVFVRRGVKDQSHNATSSDVSWFFTTDKVPDTTPPLVVRGIPQENEGVFVKTLITALFNGPIDSGTLTGNFVVVGREGNVPGEVHYVESSRTAIFAPFRSDGALNARLEYSTTYTVVLGSGIKDLAGNSLVQESWTFTTIDPPQVIERSPVGEEIPTDPPPPIRAVFSREMKGNSINQSSFHVAHIDPLNQQGGTVPGAVSYADGVATFTPSIPLSDNSLYRVTLTTAIEDLNANPLPAEVTWSFKTAAPPDTPPRVASTTPADGAINVSVNISSLSAQFVRPVDASSLQGQFTVQDADGNVLVGRIEYDVGQQRAAFVLTQGPLAFNAAYTAVIGAGVRSTSGTPMGSDHVWTFTTEAAPDTILPSVVGSDPPDGARDVPATDLSGQPFPIRVDFSEPILSSTVHAATFTVKRVESESEKPELSGTYRFESSSVFFVPSSPYERGKTYEVTLTTGIADLAGNHLPFNVILSFTTVP